MRSMNFLGKKPAHTRPPAPDAAGSSTTRQRGNAAEDQALAFLQAAGLKLLERNYRTPGRGGGEIDLVMRDRDGTLVFVEVRARSSARFGGAAASIGAGKCRRLRQAAEAFLLTRSRPLPPCRFDAVCFEGSDEPVWLRQIDV